MSQAVDNYQNNQQPLNTDTRDALLAKVQSFYGVVSTIDFLITTILVIVVAICIFVGFSKSSFGLILGGVVGGILFWVLKVLLFGITYTLLSISANTRGL